MKFRSVTWLQLMERAEATVRTASTVFKALREATWHGSRSAQVNVHDFPMSPRNQPLGIAVVVAKAEVVVKDMLVDAGTSVEDAATHILWKFPMPEGVVSSGHVATQLPA